MGRTCSAVTSTFHAQLTCLLSSFLFGSLTPQQAAVGVKDRKRGIPTLAVIRPDGSTITLDGDEQVEKLGLDALKAWEA